MNLRELTEQVVLQEQQALDLSLVSSDRVHAEDIQQAWKDAHALELKLRHHGAAGRGLIGRLGSVIGDLMCAGRRIGNFSQAAA